MGTVVSIGSITVDVQVRVPDLPAVPGLTMGTDLLLASGGKAANAAVVAARLGADVVLLGCVGEGAVGEFALRGPGAIGLDTSEVRRRPLPTAVSLVEVLPDGDKHIVLTLGASDAWGDDAEGVEDRVGTLPAGSVVRLDHEIPVAIVDAALRGAGRSGAITVLDPSPAERITAELVRACDHVTPDHLGAGRLVECPVDDDDDGLEAATRLAELHTVPYVKLPGGTCAVVWSGGRVLVEPPPVSPIDTNGAGDAFAGALATALAAGLAPPEAAVRAVAASTCAVRRYGGQLTELTEQELLDVARRITVRPA